MANVTTKDTTPQLLDLASDPDTLLFVTPLQVMGLSTVYAAGLHWLERRYPIKPDHTWAEVMGGVVISLLPVALAARKRGSIDWQLYEHAVWRSFLAAGMPIILWQLGEAVVRHGEFLQYTAKRSARSDDYDADATTSLASGSRGRPRGSTLCRERGDPAAPDGAGDA